MCVVIQNFYVFLRAEWAHLTFGEAPKNDLDKNARATRSVNQYSSVAGSAHLQPLFYSPSCWNDWLMVVAELSKIKRRT